MELRWAAGNIMPEHDSDSGTLGHFYDTHQVTPHRDLYFAKVPVAMKHYKGQIVHLALHIDVGRVSTVQINDISCCIRTDHLAV